MKPTLLRIPPAHFSASRWSGGVTNEIAIGPAGARYADRDFLWRVSSATVELEASDFTPLPDYLRFLATLEGTITLFHHGADPIFLSPGKVHRFDGGAPTRSQGACVDFNLMLRKDACRGELRYLRLAEGGRLRLTPSLDCGTRLPILVVYCAEGDGSLSIDGSAVSFVQGEAAMAEQAVPLLQCNGASAFLICEILER